MFRLPWQESWTLGIDLIDVEHQSLVDGVNQLAARFTLDPAQAAEPVGMGGGGNPHDTCLLYTSPSPRDRTRYRMPSSA